MEEIVALVVQKTGIPKETAQQAERVTIVLLFIVSSTIPDPYVHISSTMD